MQDSFSDKIFPAVSVLGYILEILINFTEASELGLMT